MALLHPASPSRGSPCHLHARASFSPRRAFVGEWPRRTILLPSQMLSFVLRCPFQRQYASWLMAPLRPCSSHLLGTESDQTLKESGAQTCVSTCVRPWLTLLFSVFLVSMCPRGSVRNEKLVLKELTTQQEPQVSSVKRLTSVCHVTRTESKRN